MALVYVFRLLRSGIPPGTIRCHISGGTVEIRPYLR